MKLKIWIGREAHAEGPNEIYILKDWERPRLRHGFWVARERIPLDPGIAYHLRLQPGDLFRLRLVR
jgi:hypothetical protein